MSTLATGVRPFPRVLPKYLLFGVIGLMLAYVIPHDESFLVHPKDSLWQHYEPFKWWLLPHGIAGGCALLLGPMQFSDRFRNRFRKLHRVVGRIYVAGVFVAAPLGLYIQFFEERMGDPRSFSIAAAVDAALWMITTGIALAFILKGKVQEHQQWITRSFAVALVFLEVRVIGGVDGRISTSMRTKPLSGSALRSRSFRRTLCFSPSNWGAQPQRSGGTRWLLLSGWSKLLRSALARSPEEAFEKVKAVASRSSAMRKLTARQFENPLLRAVRGHR